MGLFLNTQDKLARLREIKFINERAIQSLTKKNLEEIFNVVLVKNEFPIGGDRADILAYDKNKQSFVIIEFKIGKKQGTLEQLTSYLNSAKKNKARLCQEYGKKFNKYFDTSEVDWDKMRGIAVAPSFDKYQLNTAEHDDYIELYEVHQYENNIFEFKRPRSTVGKIAQKKSKKSSVIEKPVEYTEAEYLNGQYLKFNLTPETKQLWFEMKHQILSLGNLKFVQKKYYSKFCPKDDTRSIGAIQATNSKLKITYNTKVRDRLLSTSDFVEDISKKGHWAPGDYRSDIMTKADIARAIQLVEKIYRSRKSP